MSALLRHVHALMLGEELDPDHGYPHTAAIRVNAGFIQYYIDQLAEITVVPGKGIRVGGNPPRANETNHVIGTCGMCKSHIREGNTYIKHNGATFCSKSCHEDWLSP